MKNIFKRFTEIVLITITLADLSCKKYLDEKSDKSLVIPQTINDFQGLLDDH